MLPTNWLDGEIGTCMVKLALVVALCVLLFSLIMALSESLPDLQGPPRVRLWVRLGARWLPTSGEYAGPAFQSRGEHQFLKKSESTATRQVALRMHAWSKILKCSLKGNSCSPSFPWPHALEGFRVGVHIMGPICCHSLPSLCTIPLIQGNLQGEGQC